MIINLELEYVDTGNLIQLCLENELFTALIYICTRSNNDFITPLNKMFSIYKVYILYR